MGWNNLVVKDNPLLKNIRAKDYVYYVHSYYVEVGEDTIATCDYGLAFSAAGTSLTGVLTVVTRSRTVC